jgi:hypothetical protein
VLPSVILFNQLKIRRLSEILNVVIKMTDCYVLQNRSVLFCFETIGMANYPFHFMQLKTSTSITISLILKIIQLKGVYRNSIQV